jgi:hypothetical protein
VALREAEIARRDAALTRREGSLASIQSQMVADIQRQEAALTAKEVEVASALVAARMASPIGASLRLASPPSNAAAGAAAAAQGHSQERSSTAGGATGADVWQQWYVAKLRDQRTMVTALRSVYPWVQEPPAASLLFSPRSVHHAAPRQAGAPRATATDQIAPVASSEAAFPRSDTAHLHDAGPPSPAASEQAAGVFPMDEGAGAFPMDAAATTLPPRLSTATAEQAAINLLRPPASWIDAPTLAWRALVHQKYPAASLPAVAAAAPAAPLQHPQEGAWLRAAAAAHEEPNRPTGAAPPPNAYERNSAALGAPAAWQRVGLATAAQEATVVPAAAGAAAVAAEAAPVARPQHLTDSSPAVSPAGRAPRARGPPVEL